MATNNSAVARKTFVITLVAVLTVTGAIAFWKLRLVVALLFLSFMIASAMRPGVENMVRYRIPRLVGVLAHYAALFGLLGFVLWFVIPNLLAEVEHAIGNVPQTRAELKNAAAHSTGIKHDVLIALQKQLKNAPSFNNLVHPALDLTKKALEILVGVFFVLACAVYWIYDRERFTDQVASFVPLSKQKKALDTWDLVELKLGAYVRAQVLMVSFVFPLLAASLAARPVGPPVERRRRPFDVGANLHG